VFGKSQSDDIFACVVSNFTKERGNMAPMNPSNCRQASAARFALIFITENRKPKTENPGPEPL
jgi:hypothetical protein